MKHRALLRRALPLAVLAAFLFALQLPASAFFFGRPEESTVAPISKNGPLGEPISFSEADFVVDGSGKLDGIVITSLPDTGAGILNLGGRAIQVGDVIAMDAVSGLCFTPMAAPASDAAGFRFTPVFADGQSGEEVSVELHLLSEANGAPVAENLTLTTYKNVAVTGQLSAVDPEGDLITYHLIKKPARGAVTMPEEGSSTFVYTPYEDKTGRQAATMRVYKHLRNDSPYGKDDQVKGFVYEINPQIGVFVAVDDRYFGMIPRTEVFAEYHYGQQVECRVLRVREDGKLDLSPRGKSYEAAGEDAEAVLAELRAHGGKLPYADKAEAKLIEEVYHMSKNQFKRAVGFLYKQRRIEIDRKQDTITLLPETKGEEKRS